MNPIRMTLVAVALLAGAQAVAQTTSYPRIIGNGENIEIDYGPMPANIVGGGRVMVTERGSMGNIDYIHLDAMFAQAPREGFVPLTVGSGESAETVWVPATMVAMVRRARASMAPR